MLPRDRNAYRIEVGQTSTRKLHEELGRLEAANRRLTDCSEPRNVEEDRFECITLITDELALRWDV